MKIDFDEIIVERKGLIDLLSDEENAILNSLLSPVFSMSFNSNRDSFYDKLAMVDCALEIVHSGIENEINAIKMCHKIQKAISNEEIRTGWRVSFACEGKSHRFFYLNDRIRERRSISFRYKLRT